MLSYNKQVERLWSFAPKMNPKESSHTQCRKKETSRRWRRKFDLGIKHLDLSTLPFSISNSNIRFHRRKPRSASLSSSSEWLTAKYILFSSLAFSVDTEILHRHVWLIKKDERICATKVVSGNHAGDSLPSAVFGAAWGTCQSRPCKNSSFTEDLGWSWLPGEEMLMHSLRHLHTHSQTCRDTGWHAGFMAAECLLYFSFPSLALT